MFLYHGISISGAGDLYSKLPIEDEETEGMVLGAEEVIQTPVKFLLKWKFLTERNINFNTMQNVILSLWRPKKDMEVHDFGSQRYVFTLYHIIDVRKVIEGGPWSFEQNLLVLQRCSKEDNPQEVPLVESEIWIQIYDLSKVFASIKVLENVGNYIGKFVKSDPANIEGSWKSSLRIRVIIRVDKQLKRRKLNGREKLELDEFYV